MSYARFLHDGSEVGIEMPEKESLRLDVNADMLTLHLPIKKPDVIVPVIELTLATE